MQLTDICYTRWGQCWAATVRQNHRLAAFDLLLDHDHDRHWYLDSYIQSTSGCTRMNKGSMEQGPNVISVRLCWVIAPGTRDSIGWICVVGLESVLRRRH